MPNAALLLFKSVVERQLQQLAGKSSYEVTFWLPAPAGNFSIWIRAYWPDQAILDGTWKPPVVKVIN